jgi:hypothetical protein
MKQIKADKENPKGSSEREQYLQEVRDKAAMKKHLNERVMTISEKSFLKRIKIEMLLGPAVSKKDK